MPFSKCTLSPRRRAIFERTQIAPRQSVADVLSTTGGLRRAQREPKGPQRAPKGHPKSSKGPSKDTFLQSFAESGPFRKSWFYCVNIYILVNGEGPGTPKGPKKATEDTLEREEESLEGQTFSQTRLRGSHGDQKVPQKDTRQSLTNQLSVPGGLRGAL